MGPAGMGRRKICAGSLALTDLMEAGVELVPEWPENEPQLLRRAVAERVAVHVAAGEVDGAGVVLVLLHVVADPLQHLRLAPEVRELAEPRRLLCWGERSRAQGRCSPHRAPGPGSGWLGRALDEPTSQGVGLALLGTESQTGGGGGGYLA